MTNGRASTRFVDVKRTFPKPIRDLHADPARPRALHPLPALHPVLRGDRRRPVHRPAEARRATSRSARSHRGVLGLRRRARASARPPRTASGRPFASLLLRQHRADLPGRRADQRGVPVPVAPVRPGLHAGRLRARRAAVGHAHRPPARRRAAPAGRRGPGGQRGVELRQGPLRVHLADRAGPADHPAGPRPRRRRARAGAAGPRRSTSPRRPAGCARRRPRTPRSASASCPAAALTLEDAYAYAQVRPRRAGHQRRRPPRPPALGRGGGVPRPPRRRPRRSRSRSPTSTAPRPCCSSAWSRRRSRPIVFLRLRKAVRAPQAAGALGRRPGRAAASSSCRARCCPPRPGTEAEVLRRHRTDRRRERRRRCSSCRGRARASSASGWPACPAAARARASRLAAAHRRPAGLGPAPRRRARRRRGRPLPGLLPGGRPVADAAARVDVAAAWGVEHAARRARPRHRRRSSPPRGRPARRPRSSAASTRPTCPTRRSPASALDARRSWSASRCAASAVTERADVVLPVAPPTEKSGTFVELGGPLAAVPAGADLARDGRPPGARRARRRRSA